MRSVDSVLFALSKNGRSPTAKLEPRWAGLGERVQLEIGHALTSLVLLAFVAGLSIGYAVLARLLHSWPPAADYTIALLVPVTGVLFAMLWTTSLRIVIEPQPVSNATLVMVASLAYLAAWLVRASVVGPDLWPFSAEVVEWIITSRAADLGASGWLSLPYLGAELAVTAAGGLALTRLYLGPQLGDPS